MQGDIGRSWNFGCTQAVQKFLEENMLYRCQCNLGVFDVSIVLFHLFRFESVPLKKVKDRDMKINFEFCIRGKNLSGIEFLGIPQTGTI